MGMGRQVKGFGIRSNVNLGLLALIYHSNITKIDYLIIIKLLQVTCSVQIGWCFLHYIDYFLTKGKMLKYCKRFVNYIIIHQKYSTLKIKVIFNTPKYQL